MASASPAVQKPPAIATPLIFLPSHLTLVFPSRPAASQSTSILMQIPAEIRLMILREVLVREEPIGDRATYDILAVGPSRDERGRFTKRFVKRGVNGYNLTPSVLGTCQGLLTDGLPVLYHENTLQLCINVELFHWMRQWPNPSIMKVAPQGRFENNRNRVAATMTAFHNHTMLRYLYSGHWSHDMQLFNVAKRFTNFLIRVDYDSDLLCTAQLRSLLFRSSKLFAGSSVQVVFDFSFPHGSRPLGHSFEELQFRSIKAFTVIRCRSFQLLSISDPKTVAVERMITNCSEIVYLEEYLPNVASILENLVESGAFSQQMPELLTLMTRLIDAVLDSDVDSFLQARHEVLMIWWGIQQQFVEEQAQAMELLKAYREAMAQNKDVDRARSEHDNFRYKLCYRYQSLRRMMDLFNVTHEPYGFVIREDYREYEKIKHVASLFIFIPVNNYDIQKWTLSSA